MLKRIAFVFNILLLIASVSFSAPGDLDLTFGGGGVVTYDGGDVDEGSGVAIQEDGKIVVVGHSTKDTEDVLVLRYNPDGTLDNTFGDNGAITYDGGGADRGNAVAIQKDGKIVVVGYSIKDTMDVLVLRYNSDGTPDNTFGDNGVVTYDGGDGCGITIQQDGKMVVVGGYSLYGTYDTLNILVLRYNPDGTLDNTFGDNGVVTYDGGYADVSNGIAIQEDGKILIVGDRFKDTGPASDVLVLRYNSDGTLDNTFGGDGVVTYHSWDMDSGKRIAIQENGKIVVVGERHNIAWTVGDVLALRFNPNGTLDNTFAGDGVAIYDSGDREGGTAIAIQEDGKIVITGVTSKSSSNVLVLRLNTNGTLDKTFGENGIVNFRGPAYDDWGFAVAIERGGNIIIAGRTFVNYHDVLVLRLHGGDPDKTPPTPNPMTWETKPHQTGTDSISMVATAAIDNDPTSPINYYFDFVGSPTGGLDGKDSGWQPGTSYTNSNLRANHKYGYRVKARDGLNNETKYSTPYQYAYTAIQPPTGVTFGTITPTSIQARSTNTPTGLSWGNSGLWIDNITKSTNSGWMRNNTLWTSKPLDPNTSYTFQAKARNGDGKETEYGPLASKYTLANLPKKDSFSDVTRTSIRANWTANGNPPGTEYFCENVTARTNSGWITGTSWNSDNLTCGISYSFRVKARNGDGIVTGWTSLGSQSTVKCVLLLKPNGGEMISSGSTYNSIEWNATPEAVSFDLYYSLDNGVSWPLIKKDERNTIYPWSVPKTIGNKKACFVRVFGYNDARTKRIGYDTSDKPFTIEVVTLINPNGGELLHAGDPLTIEWRPCSDAVKFDLMVSFDNGVNWRFIDDKATPKVIEGKGVTGTTLTTKVPSPGTGNSKACFIKVIAYNEAGKQIGSDASDKPFTIEVVKLTSPNGGETLTQGDSIDITWTSYESSEPITKVQLFYTKDAGVTWDSIPGPSGNIFPPGDYSQSWKVPCVGTTPKTNCKLKVVLKDLKGVIRGSDVSNNYLTIKSLVPDLIETSVSDPPVTALPGSIFSVTDRVENRGNGDAVRSTTQYYLFVDTSKNTGDILLTGTRSVPALVPGASSMDTVDVTIPSSTAAGTYYLLACADDLKKIAESNEKNNCMASSTTVQIQRPDLVETSVSEPPQQPRTVGATFSVTDTAKNQGKADAESSTTRYYLSADKTKGSGDILLMGTRSVPPLATGEFSTGTVKVKIPSGIAARAYYLLACGDDLKAVAESDETNNCISSTGTVQINGPDLIETSLTNPPGSRRVGSTFSVTDRVTNQGNIAAGFSVTLYYLSKDTVKGSEDIVVGGRVLAGLGPGATSVGTEIATIPSDTPPGAYYLLACADDTEEVDETDDKNNCIASTSKIQVTP